MKKQLSSLELHFLVKELEILKGSRIDKIYQPEKNTIIFSFYKTNVGKKILKIDIGKYLALAEEKEAGDTLGFGMLLRKHLDGFFIFDIEQVKPERIAKFSFKAKDDVKYLYVEFFGKGNAILCDEHNVIINALEHHEFRERVVKPRLKYVYPVMGCNVFDLDNQKLKNMFQESKKDSVIVSLATELGLGGLYSEEICLSASFDKNKNPKNADDKDVGSVVSSIKKILGRNIGAKVIFKESKPIDVMPFEIEFYKNYESRPFETFSKALNYFYSQFEEVKESAYDKKIKELTRIIEQQENAIKELKKEELELREKGEMIYHKYTLIKEVLDELNKASKKHSWKEIKEKLKDHKMIKEINEKEKKVVVEV